MLSTIYWWSTVHEIEDLNPYLGTGWTVKMVCLIWGNILIHPTQKWAIVWCILTVHSKRLGCDCVTLTHTVWIGRGKGEGGMTYECMTSEVNQWKLNFLKKKKKHKVELVEGVFGLNRMTQFGSLGILWLRIRWAYFETASKGNYKRTRISKGNYMWSGTVILQKTQTYIPTRISKGNYMWFFFFFLMG